MARIIVVGGGAAGLVAAWRAATRGHSVCLMEANDRVGVKLRISGGGKCNVTHAGPVGTLLAAFPPTQARFLRRAFHAFSNEDVVALLRGEGVETEARENGRVFPLDRPGSAAEVVAAFRQRAEGAGVEIRCGLRATGLLGEAPRAAAVLAGAERLEGEAFILAPGGASFPKTGSLGEGLAWMAALGVPVRPWAPALAPIPLREPHPAWEGTAFRGGSLHLRAGREGRRLAAFAGDLVFTREGISRPAALELSQVAEAARRSGACWLSYDFAGTAGEGLEGELLGVAQTGPHRSVRAWLQAWIPERVAQSLWAQEGWGELRMRALSKAQRKQMIAWLRAFPLGEAGPVPLARGEVSAGGVSLSAVDPRTMRLRRWENLSVCGELLDVDGPIGGYNLQAAFSTGFLAGEHAGG